MATERIVIIVSENGTDTVVKKIKGVGDEAKRSGDSVSFLQNALGLLGSAATLKGILQTVDAFQEMTNKLRTVSRSEEEATLAIQKLLDVSNRSRSSFEDTVTLYQRVVRSTEQLGVSHAQSARIVETLNKAIIVGGVSAREASAALIQLSQGFSAGVLRGQELRSVMTQMPLVADILAAKLNTTIGGLLKLGPQGKISAKVMADALLEASDKIDAAFAKTTPTITQSLVVLKNQFLKFIGDVNAKFDIIGKVTGLIDFLSDHIDAFARGVLAGVLVLGVTKAIQAINLFTAAIAANPIGAIAVAITAATAAIITFSDQIPLASDSVATLGDFFAVLWQEIVDDAKFVADFLVEKFGFLSDVLKDIFGTQFEFSVRGFLRTGAVMIDRFVGLFVGLKNAVVQIFTNIPATIENVFTRLVNIILVRLEIFINNVIAEMNKVLVSAKLNPMNFVNFGRLNMSKEAEQQGKAISDAFIKGFSGVTDAQDLVEKLLNKSESRAKDRLKKQQEEQARIKSGQADFDKIQNSGNEQITRATEIDGIVEKLNNEAEALAKVIENRKISNDYVRIEQALRSKGIQLTDGESKNIQSLLERNELLKQMQKEYQSIIGPEEEHARRMEALTNLYNSGKISVEQYTVALRQSKIQQLETSRDVASGFQRGFLKIQDEITNFATLSEQTVTDAFHGMEDALVNFVKTGKLNFSSLVDSILADLTRLLFRRP
jgi:tape measure domain-containing protein